MKTSLKSLAAVIALAAAGLAQAQSHTITFGADREIPPNLVNGNWIAINQDFGDPCVASFWGVELSVDSFTWLGDTFTNPVWSTGSIADCVKAPDDLLLMSLAGGTGGPSGLDGSYRVVYNLGGYPNCSGTSPFPLTGGSSTASPANWSCIQVTVIADVVLLPSTPKFTPQYIGVVAKGIDGSATKTLTWDVR